MTQWGPVVSVSLSSSLLVSVKRFEGLLQPYKLKNVHKDEQYEQSGIPATGSRPWMVSDEDMEKNKAKVRMFWDHASCWGLMGCVDNKVEHIAIVVLGGQFTTLGSLRCDTLMCVNYSV